MWDDFRLEVPYRQGVCKDNEHDWKVFLGIFKVKFKNLLALNFSFNPNSMASNFTPLCGTESCVENVGSYHMTMISELCDMKLLGYNYYK